MDLAVGAGLLLLAVIVMILGNWLKPPARLTSRTIAGLFVVALVAYLGVGVYDRLATNAPPSAGNATATPTEPRPTAISPYVDAARFVRFGDRHGIFTLDADGSTLTIPSPPDSERQWGGALVGPSRCSAEISFDVRIEGGNTSYYGFGVAPRGSVEDDQPSGGALLYYHDSDGGYIAAWSVLPVPGIGGIGGGAYPVPDPHETRHVTITADESAFEVTVDAQRTGTYAEQEIECGVPLFFVWGGATAHFDRIETRLR
jgi:hypothetical protein